MDVIRLQTSVANLFIQHCLQVGLGRIGQKKGQPNSLTLIVKLNLWIHILDHYLQLKLPKSFTLFIVRWMFITSFYQYTEQLLTKVFSAGKV